jgi:hypothetical protein
MNVPLDVELETEAQVGGLGEALAGVVWQPVAPDAKSR